MEQVDVLYAPRPEQFVTDGEPRGLSYYPQTEKAREWFKIFFSDTDGGYPFTDAEPAVDWLKSEGMTAAPKDTP